MRDEGNIIFCLKITIFFFGENIDSKLDFEDSLMKLERHKNPH